jgi:hypothetical protein
VAKARTRRQVIKSDTDTTPDGAEWRGEYVNWGGEQKKVFHEKREIAKSEPIIDPETNRPMYKRGQAGQTTGQVYRIRTVVGHEDREFIQISLGNGMSTKHYDFRESQEEIDARAKRARREQLLDKLFEKAEAVGGLDALLEDDEPDPPTPASARKTRQAA